MNRWLVSSYNLFPITLSTRQARSRHSDSGAPSGRSLVLWQCVRRTVEHLGFVYLGFRFFLPWIDQNQQCSSIYGHGIQLHHKASRIFSYLAFHRLLYNIHRLVTYTLWKHQRCEVTRILQTRTLNEQNYLKVNGIYLEPLDSLIDARARFDHRIFSKPRRAMNQLCQRKECLVPGKISLVISLLLQCWSD